MGNVQTSVIICSHNPREEYLTRTLQSLKVQSYAQDMWELILIDNASDNPLNDRFDLSWHMNSRHIQENKLGLVNARLCAMRAAAGNLLVFVDDDNVLDAEYVSRSVNISKQFPYIGVWGGQQKGEFEGPVPNYAMKFLGNLACREISRQAWSNVPFQYETMPVGAGMCVRGEVAAAYLHSAENDQNILKLARSGKALSGCEDHDIALTACQIGFGTGVFPELKLTHLISKKRLEKGYLLRLLEADAYSSVVLRHIRHCPIQPRQNKISKTVRKMRILAMQGVFAFRVENAKDHGICRAYNDIRTM